MTDFPDSIGPVLGEATVIVQNFADAESPPPPVITKCPITITEILPNPDGSYTMPDGSRFVLPEQLVRETK